MSDVLLMDLVSTKILSKILFVVFSSHQRWVKQEGQDGPGSLTWFFEIAFANFFFSLSEKNLQELLNVCTVQEASIH